EIVGSELRKPAPVEVHDSFPRIENLEDLRLVGLCVLFNLLLREWRPRRRAARGVADHAREIADQEDDRVPEILKMLELAQQNRVPKVQVGRRRIESGLHPQGFARGARLLQLGAE